MEDSAEKNDGKRFGFPYALIGECKDPKTKETVVVYPFLNDSNEKDYILTTIAMKYQPWTAKHGDTDTMYSEFFTELKKTPDHNGNFIFSGAKLSTCKKRVSNILKLEEKWFEKSGVDREVKVQKNGSLMLIDHDYESDDFYEEDDGTNYACKIRALVIEMMNSQHDTKMKTKKKPPAQIVETGEEAPLITHATTCGSLAWKGEALESLAKKPKSVDIQDPSGEDAKPSGKKTPPLRTNEIESQLTYLRENKLYKHDLNLKKIEVAKVKEEKEKVKEEKEKDIVATKKLRLQMKLEKMKQETLRLEAAKNNSDMDK